MYVDDPGTTAGAGWSVDPEQVQQFARAVEAVRANLEAITRQVEDLSTPNYAPMLGTSPVGQELAEKFADRMGSERGLRGQLNVALARMEEFVSSAELTASQYLQSDQDSASRLGYV
jgi:hypothetical protein